MKSVIFSYHCAILVLRRITLANDFYRFNRTSLLFLFKRQGCGQSVRMEHVHSMARIFMPVECVYLVHVKHNSAIDDILHPACAAINNSVAHYFCFLRTTDLMIFYSARVMPDADRVNGTCMTNGEQTIHANNVSIIGPTTEARTTGVLSLPFSQPHR